MIERLASRHVVLLGIGHTNAHVVRMWRMQTPRDADLTCLSNFSYATYSGMLPALLAGQIPASQMEINLVALCNAAGARLITDEVTGIDHANREIQFANRPAVPFDVLSVGVGSIASMNEVAIDSDTLVPIKPMQSFLRRLEQAIVRGRARRKGGPISLIVVGAGVAGIEITSCLPNFLAKLGIDDYRLAMVTRSDEIAPEVTQRARKLIAHAWASRNIDVMTGRAVRRLEPGSAELDDGRSIEADVVIWATGASPPPLLSKLDLALDERGFVATHHTLESTNRRHVFAVGDTGTIVGENLPKAGVYAVRQGPVLWENIQRCLDDRPLQAYDPQHNFLKLMNLGDGTAVGQWKGLSQRGRWVMRLKHRIDSGFMDMFDVVSMSSDSSDSVDPMQCRGCGCKLGAAALRDALAVSHEIEAEDAVRIGGQTGDGQLLASTDFFSAPLNDAFLVGRIAALHAASDLVASGATVTEALANVVVPEGDPKTQQRVVSDFLAGAEREFAAFDAGIVGGHTIVGPRMEVGFTVIGRLMSSRPMRKSNLLSGDQLLLTKPIGIGVLLAAYHRSQCPARAYDSLIEAMLKPQHEAARLAVELGVLAATDVTGFGLVGHLIEMADSSQVSAEIRLDQVPCLPSAVDLVQSGIESSLLPDNLCAEQFVKVDKRLRDRPEYLLLFDPQTCGGLLLGMKPKQVEGFQQRMQEAGMEPAAVVGEVIPRQTFSVGIK
jgi:selenide,water dikinase